MHMCICIDMYDVCTYLMLLLTCLTLMPACRYSICGILIAAEQGSASSKV